MAKVKKVEAEIGIIMGSKSDWPTMEAAAKMLENFGVAYTAAVVSAHRTPDKMMKYAEAAEGRGLKAIIADPCAGARCAGEEQRVEWT
jgi:5-(carboxyamino)imidazole ribonucleotide mutase